MKNLLLSACAICFATGASAATVAGNPTVEDNGGGSFTFIFDKWGDILGEGDGMTFANPNGPDILAIGSNDLIQDFPNNGGLGVNFGTNGDNIGDGESIEFIFSQAVNILGITLNGDHTDAASGLLELGTSANMSIGAGDASIIDGIDDDPIFSDFCGFQASFCNVTSLFLESTGFNGYVESITIQAVPVPASLAFLLSGVAAFGVASKRRKA